MARNALADVLQQSAFWLMDLAPAGGNSLPIFSPLAGFSSISAPEIKLETETIREGNWPFSTTVIKGGSVSQITLKRGSTVFNSDFYRWFRSAQFGGINGTLDAQIGGPTYRRTMLLLQFFSNVPLLPDAGLGGGGAAVLAGAALVNSSIGLAAGNFVGGSFSASAATGLSDFGNVGDIAIRIPAKAWILYDCIPVRYRGAGDFDGTSSQISIQELDIQPGYMEEVSVAS